MEPYCASDEFLKVKAKKGDALVFFSVSTNKVLDERVVSDNCPFARVCRRPSRVNTWLTWASPILAIAPFSVAWRVPSDEGREICCPEMGQAVPGPQLPA